eukprot:16444921-Heterocapsa_arctica.AAC.1
MRKYQTLVNRKQETGEEGVQLIYKLEDNILLHNLENIEEKLDNNMRTTLKNDRSQRWRSWVENSWGHKKKDIYKLIRGKKSGPLIVSDGG